MADADQVDQTATKTSSGEMPQQLRARLTELTERAAAKDAIKDFNTAAELYSQATELQAQLNGEMSVDNADLLYAYGKSLYNVAVSKSDVLGSKVAGEPATEPKNPSAGNTKSAVSNGISQGVVDSVVNESGIKKTITDEEKAQPKTTKDQPYFQFTGDENFDISDSDLAEDTDNAAGGEEEDDFANAFEVLDLARILLLRKLSEKENNRTGSGKSSDMSPEVKRLKERLADTYDLQAEISLEAERFMDAVVDLRAALELKQSLFPFEDPSIAECHYKLSLALEFSAVNGQKAADNSVSDDQMTGRDNIMREEAAKHMETAIESCKIRMTQEQKKLENGQVTDEGKVAAVKRKIANVKDIVVDMEQRLADLRRPPVSINHPDQNGDDLNPLKGILGQILGQSPEERKARLEEATKNANDLSSFVRKKQPADELARSSDISKDATREKRSAEETANEEAAKRGRFEEIN